MRHLLFATTAACLLLSAAPVSAARVLYSYDDKDGTSFVAISQSGYATDLDSSNRVNCVVGGRLCAGIEVAQRRFFDNNMGVTVRGVEVGSFDSGPGGQKSVSLFQSDALGASGTYYGSELLRVTSGGITLPELGRADFGRLIVSELADTDVVYAYADRNGNSAVLVTDGFLDPATFVNSPARNCARGAVYCSRIVIDPFVTVPGTSTPGVAVVPLTTSARGQGIFDLGVLTAEGMTTGAFVDPDGTATRGYARLGVIGPVSTALPDPPAAMPEPATWATMLLGFGLVGAAARRGRGRMAAA